MRIELTKREERPHYVADLVDLPGSPPLGEGDTPELAVANLWLRLVQDADKWRKYMELGERIEIVEKEKGFVKRYLVFGGMEKLGGWLDYLGSTDSLPAARAVLRSVKKPIMWWHIVDTETGDIIVPAEVKN